MSSERVTIEIVCPGSRYAKVSKDWKEWRKEHFGKMVSKYPFFKWKSNGMTIECEYIREPDPVNPGKEITREFKITYQGPEDTPELEQIRAWFEPPKRSVDKLLKELKAKWAYKISLEQQRGAPEGFIKAMERDRDKEIEQLLAEE